MPEELETPQGDPPDTGDSTPGSPSDDWESRFKGLQATVTPLQQDRATLRSELDSTKGQVEQLQTMVQASLSDKEQAAAPPSLFETWKGDELREEIARDPAKILDEVQKGFGSMLALIQQRDGAYEQLVAAAKEELGGQIGAIEVAPRVEAHQATLEKLKANPAYAGMSPTHLLAVAETLDGGIESVTAPGSPVASRGAPSTPKPAKTQQSHPALWAATIDMAGGDQEKAKRIFERMNKQGRG